MPKEIPPGPLSPEEEARLETKRFDELRDRRINGVYDEFIATREDLSSEQKSFVLTSMLSNPEYEWGQVDGEDVVIASITKTPENHLEFNFGMYGMEWGSPRRIKLP